MQYHAFPGASEGRKPGLQSPSLPPQAAAHALQEFEIRQEPSLQVAPQEPLYPLEQTASGEPTRVPCGKTVEVLVISQLDTVGSPEPEQ